MMPSPLSDIIARAPVTEPESRLMTRPWQTLLQLLVTRVGGFGTHTTLTELDDWLAAAEATGLFLPVAPAVSQPGLARVPAPPPMPPQDWRPQARGSPRQETPLAPLAPVVPRQEPPLPGLAQRAASLQALTQRVQDLEAASAFRAPPPWTLDTLAQLFVMLGTAQTISGLKTFNLGAAAPFAVAAASLLVANLDADKWDGQDYSEGSCTVTGTGFTVNPTGTALYVKVGKLVSLCLPQLLGTSNAGTFTITGLAAAITPTQTTYTAWLVQDNAVQQFGWIGLTAASTTLTLAPDATGVTLWTAAGQKASFSNWLTYALL